VIPVRLRPLLPGSALLLLFLACSCSGYRPVKKVVLPVGGTDGIAVSFGSNGEIGAPSAIVLKHGLVWVAEAGTSAVKAYDLKGGLRKSFALSLQGRSPLIDDMMIDDKSMVYAFESAVVPTGGTNGEFAAVLLLNQFSPDGEYVKTLTSLNGILRGTSENSYGQLTLFVQDPGADWLVLRFIGGVNVKTLRFASSAATNAGGSAINNICPLANDNILLIERIPVSAAGDGPPSYSLYDMLTGRESPVDLVRPALLRQGYFLYGTDRAGGVYLMKRSGRSRVSVLRLDLSRDRAARLPGGPAKRWSLPSRNADGILLEPRIDHDGNVYQVRLGKRQLRVVLYR
jgi:hypothetical protein